METSQRSYNAMLYAYSAKLADSSSKFIIVTKVQLVANLIRHLINSQKVSVAHFLQKLIGSE